MQSVQATLRQERDKARRNYELAMERIGLLRDEVECVESSVQERQMQLAKINQERKQVDAKVSIRTKVENLAKEVGYAVPLRFQIILQRRISILIQSPSFFVFSSAFNMPRF